MSETRARSWWRRWVAWLRTGETTAEWMWRTGRTRRGQEMLAGVVIPPPLADGPPSPPPVASGRRPEDGSHMRCYWCGTDCAGRFDLIHVPGRNVPVCKGSFGTRAGCPKEDDR